MDIGDETASCQNPRKSEPSRNVDLGAVDDAGFPTP